MLKKGLLDQACINKPQGVSGCMSQVKDTKNKGEILLSVTEYAFNSKVVGELLSTFKNL